MPDLRRKDNGSLLHRLDDIIILMVLARLSRCVGHSDIIELDRHNFNKFRKMGMLVNGMPSKSTLHRVDKGMDELKFADTMSMQKDIIELMKKGADFLIEIKANQRSLRYEVEDGLREHSPLHSYTEGTELGHGRIETRTYHTYDGLGLIADKEKVMTEIMRHISMSFTNLMGFLRQKFSILIKS